MNWIEIEKSYGFKKLPAHTIAFFRQSWKIIMINSLPNWNWIIFSTLICEQVFNGSYGSEEENRLEENLDQVGIK